MTDNSLEQFIQRTRALWGPIGDDLVDRCRRSFVELVATPATAPWVAALHEEAPASRELHRDAEHGFLLLAHTEQEGLYRAPHDHGRGWVIYALQRGAIRMSTYARIETDAGIRLVKREESLLRAGEARLFLPGDIHDTRCVAGPALLLRLTDRDLRAEDAVARRVTRYVERDGVWTVGP